MLDRYRPSGLCPATFAILAVPALAAAVVIGVVYELAMQYIPLIYLDILATGGAVFLLFLLGTAIVTWSKCRHPGVAGVLGALLGAVAWATSFVFAWWWTVRGVQNPVGLFEYLPKRASIGFTIGRSSSGIPITGVFAYALWTIEGLIFIVATMALTSNSAHRPFCESCGLWAKHKKFSFVVDRPGVVTVEALGKATELPDLVPDPSKKEEQGPEGTRLVYDIVGCSACAGVDHLNVDFKYIVLENKKTTEKSKTLHTSVLVGQEELDAIRAFAEASPPAAQA